MERHDRRGERGDSLCPASLPAIARLTPRHQGANSRAIWQRPDWQVQKSYNKLQLSRTSVIPSSPPVPVSQRPPNVPSLFASVLAFSSGVGFAIPPGLRDSGLLDGTAVACGTGDAFMAQETVGWSTTAACLGDRAAARTPSSPAMNPNSPQPPPSVGIVSPSTNCQQAAQHGLVSPRGRRLSQPPRGVRPVRRRRFPSRHTATGLPCESSPGFTPLPCLRQATGSPTRRWLSHTSA
jgi:hypothetical protein